MSIARDSLNENMLLTLSEKVKAWDENFRLLTDMSLRIAKLEENAHISKVANETEIPTSSPITPRETRAIEGNFQPIKLKDAIESVSVFDGHQPSIFQFLRAYERARNMVPRHQEPQLVKLLINKLCGHAFLAVGDCQIISLNDFGNKLKDMFGPGKTVNEYRGELETVFQRPREDTRDVFVMEFPNEMYLRVKVAGYQFLDDAYRQAVRATRELK